MPTTCFDDPKQILGSEICVVSLSKDGQGEIDLLSSTPRNDDQRCPTERPYIRYHQRRSRARKAVCAEHREVRFRRSSLCVQQVSESWNQGGAVIRYEEVHPHAYHSAFDSKSGLPRYIAFYNLRRRHRSLDARTPDHVYFTLSPLAAAA